MDARAIFFRSLCWKGAWITANKFSDIGYFHSREIGEIGQKCMGLNLTSRQRAMLAAMQLRVWAADEQEAWSDVSSHALSGNKKAPSVARPIAPLAAVAKAPPQRQEAQVGRSFAPKQALHFDAPTPASATLRSGGLWLHAPCVLYPQADATQTPARLGHSWLVLAEAWDQSADARYAPFQFEAGSLLNNMLRAIQLQHHAKVYWAALEHSKGAPTEYPDAPHKAQTLQTGLPELLARLQPSMVLVMGRKASQAVLQSDAALGHLRGQVHDCYGYPAVVTYDPAYLLRAPIEKAKAWADLCLALATVERQNSPISS